MALLKTTPELKAIFSTIDADYNFNSLKSFIDDAEQDIVIPWIGLEIYTVVSTAYNAGPIAPGVIADVLFYLQKAVTHLALMLAADSGSVRLADGGLYVIVTATNKPVSDKKMLAFTRGRRESGYKGLEQAIEYMETNIANEALATYAGSDAHKQHRAYFINSAVAFTGYYKKVNNSAYLFWQLMDALDFCERKYIAPVLGQSYFASLKAAVLAGSLSDAQKALMPYILRPLANYTIAQGLQNLPVDFDGTNLVIKSEPATGTFDAAGASTAATLAQMQAMSGDAMATGKAELRSLEDYLVTNAASLPGYTPPADDDDVNINCPGSPTFFV